MLQNFLDGKKKYSALILTLAAAVIPILVQDPETQKTILDVVPSASALIAGVFYIITQGKIDQEKERAAGVAITNLVNGTTPLVQQAQAAGAVSAGAAILSVPDEPAPPLDIAAFHQTVLAEVQATYKETNAATIFYKARDKGQVTPALDLSQAIDYWNYLSDLAVDARDYLKVLTEKKAGTCGRSPEYYVFQRDFDGIIRAAAHLYSLRELRVDWKSKLAPFQRTLYMIGILAEQLR